MARPEIQGLKYFPFDIGFFRDKKVRLLRAEHNAEGLEVYQRILCRCYEDNGYYSEWDENVDYALIAEDTGYSIEKIRLIVATCLRRSLFDNKLFKVGNVLTSRGIQRRYFSAVKETKVKAAAQGRHTYIEKDMCLLTDTDLSELNKSCVWLKVTQNSGYSGNNGGYSRNNSDNSPNNHPKGNERKIKESKVPTYPAQSGCKYKDGGCGDTSGSFQSCVAYYEKLFGVIGPTVADTLNDFIDSGVEEAVIKRAMDLSFEENVTRKWAYAKRILDNCVVEKAYTLKQFEDRQKRWKEANKRTKGGEDEFNRRNNFRGRGAKTSEPRYDIKWN